METGQPVSFEQYYPPLDTWFDVRATPNDDGLSVYFHDITNRVRAEQDAVRLAGEREAALAETGAATGRLQILSAASARLAGTLEVDELLRILGDVVLNGFGEGLVVALDERILDDSRRLGDADRLRRRRGAFGRARRRTCRWRPRCDFGRGGAAPSSAIGSPARRARASALGERPALALPLRLARAPARRRGRDRAGRGRARSPRAGRARRARRRRARQRPALRRRAPPRDHAAALAAADRAAQAARGSSSPRATCPGAGGSDVGGDFYLGHALEDGRLLLVIGDVMGHGAQAAARMGQLRAVLAAYAYEGDPPDRVLAHLSAARRRCWTCRWRPCWPRSTTRIARVSRSRSPATCRRWSRRSTAPRRSPRPRPGRRWGRRDRLRAPHASRCPPGATLVLYTDGLIEDRKRSIDVGLELLRERAASTSRLPPEAVCDQILRALGPRATARRTTSRCWSCATRRSAVLEPRRARLAARATAAGRGARARARGPSRWWRERISSRRSAGIGTGRRSGAPGASPSISTRQRAELARTRHSPPPARATVRAKRRRERHDPVRRPGGDRGRRDPVHAAAREGHARAASKPPGPTTSARRTPRPSSSPRRRSRRPATARRSAPVTRAPSRCGDQYWPSHGTDCAGPSGPQRRAAAIRAARRSARSGAGPSRPSASPRRRAVRRDVHAEPVRIDPGVVGDHRALEPARLGGAASSSPRSRARRGRRPRSPRRSSPAPRSASSSPRAPTPCARRCRRTDRSAPVRR